MAFDDLLKDLGAHLGTNLKSDAHQSCLLNFSAGPSVQIDLDQDADYILMGSKLGILSPGTFQKRIFKQSLIANALSKPHGTLAFSEKNQTLVLFQFLPIGYLNGEKLLKILQIFHEHAKIWFEALQKGEVPQIDVGKRGSKSGFLGL